MHEVGVADGIIKTVLECACKNNVSGVKSVALKVGTLSGVEPSSLSFALDCLKADTILANTTFDIEIVKAKGICGVCGKESSMEQFFSKCEHCEAPAVELFQGKEFEIMYIDTED